MSGGPLPRVAGSRRLFLAYLALLAWLPLPMASIKPWGQAIMAVWAFTLVAWHLATRPPSTVPSPTLPLGARLALGLLGAWALYIFLQWLPLPAGLVQTLSPRAYATYHALEMAGLPAAYRLSLDPWATLSAGYKTLALLSILYLTLVLAHSEGRIRLLGRVILYSALFQALYGSAMALSGLEYGFFVKKSAYLGVATGTFVNRNHLAGYLVMSLAVGIGLLLADLSPPRHVAHWRQRLRDLLKLLFSPKMRLRIYLALLVTALILTRSRMGNTAFFVSLLVAGGITLLFSRRLARKTVILLASLIVIDLFLLGAWFGIERVAERLEHTSMETESRDEIAAGVLRMWEDFRWTGSGAGSFYSVFPAYKDGTIGNHYYHAHNDYLQFLAEGGPLGLLLPGAAVVLSLWAAITALRHRRHPLVRGMAFATLMGVTAILIHSTVDFNLQMPANAAMFMVLMGLAWVGSGVGRGSARMQFTWSGR